ncbi:MAG: cadherin domain-containing protein [Desulfuromonadaceae bacterium]|nr:cadherin domain-containing protein [Desulfuromonas sp.]MDY0185136.1 cadherin domain-containing protein [Desulfuromonadaceae bacterium]
MGQPQSAPTSPNFTGILHADTPTYIVNSGFYTRLYDAAGNQHITVQPGGSLSLRGSLGNNSITLPGDSDAWTVSRDGSVAVFTNAAGSVVEVPATRTAQTINFDDKAGLELAIDVSGTEPALLLGAQILVADADGAAIDFTPPEFTSRVLALVGDNQDAGVVVYAAEATDASEVVTYSIKADAEDFASFSINPETGAVTLLDEPDYATKPAYNFTVVATDAVGNSAEKSVTLEVQDKTPPEITGATITENGRIALFFSERISSFDLNTLNVTVGGESVEISSLDSSYSSPVIMSLSRFINPDTTEEIVVEYIYDGSDPNKLITDHAGNAMLDQRFVVENKVVPELTLLEALEAETLPQDYYLFNGYVDLGVLTVADVPSAKAAAQAIVDGALNAASVNRQDNYTLADTLENLLGAAEGVLDDATSYSLTDETTEMGELDGASFTVAYGATNKSDYTFNLAPLENPYEGAQAPWTLVMETSSDFFIPRGSLFGERSIFISDGTASGTESLALDGVEDSLIFAITPDESGVYYFNDYDGYLGYSDGTVTDAVNLAEDEFLAYQSFVNNEHVIIAEKYAVIVSDGTPSGTSTQSIDYPIFPGIRDIQRQKYWFATVKDDSGIELAQFDYSSDSDYNTVLVKDIWPEGGDGLDGNLRNSENSALLPDGRLIFKANDGEHGDEPWVSDGTEAGTFMLLDLYRDGENGSGSRQFTPFNDSVVFAADVYDGSLGELGRELVVTDGTTAGTSVLDINPGGSPSYPIILGQAGELLYFTAADADGVGMFSTDGTDFTKLAAINNAAQMLAWNEKVAFFKAVDATSGVELWAADLSGSAAVDAAFYMVRDILPGTGSALDSSTDVIAVDNSIAFNANTSDTYQSFFLSDGTDAGTIRLSVDPALTTEVVDSVLVFATADAVYSVDAGAAAPAATRLLGAVGTTEMQSDANQVFIMLENGELHATDGTRAGTQALASDVENFKVIAEDAIFFVQNSTSGKSLWYSDGSADGTYCIEALLPDFYYDMSSAVGIKTAGYSLNRGVADTGATEYAGGFAGDDGAVALLGLVEDGGIFSLPAA